MLIEICAILAMPFIVFGIPLIILYLMIKKEERLDRARRKALLTALINAINEDGKRHGYTEDMMTKFDDSK
jgi:hypothetical protein